MKMLFFAILDIQGGNQYSQKRHICNNISGGDHQHLLLRHPKDCKNTKFRKHISEGSIGEEFQWSSGTIFSHFLCLSFYALYIIES